MTRLSTLAQLKDSESISNNWSDEYVLTKENLHHEFLLGDRSLSRVQLQWTYDRKVVNLPPTTFYISIGKRIFDITLSLFVILFILSWLIPIVGSLILCQSTGPFLFIQPRSGRKGKPFPCLKFRTMHHVPSRQKGDFRQTAHNDERITAVGRFLRKTNIDEMPQFINVLLGHMSVVGPRPHAVSHDAQHWLSVAYRERYWVRPGITGLAQVRGARGATTHKQRMEHRVRYDHLYIPRQTFGLDLKICYRTVKLMLKGDANAW